MVELSKKLVLTNLFIDINEGRSKVLRLIVGLLIALFALALQLQFEPYRAPLLLPLELPRTHQLSGA